MLYVDFTEKLLGLQDIIVTEIVQTEKDILTSAKLERKSHNCIRFGTATDTVHDY